MLKRGLCTLLWPAHLKPKNGELLSSWLVRLSTAHGLKPYIFLSTIWSQNLWNQRDIDRINNQAFFELIAERTGTPVSEILSTSLTEYQGRVFEVPALGGVTPWLIPRDNILIWKPTYFSLQYCPFCLLEDKEPYFRRQWRLAFVVFCVKHKAPLLDRCAKCSAAINFYLNAQNKEDKGSDSLTTCYNCKFDLREAGLKVEFAHDPAALNFQKNLLESAEQDWSEIPHIGQLHSLLFFGGLRNMAYALVAKHTRINNLLRRALEYYSIQDASSQLPPRATIESLEIDTRRTVILVMQKLLNHWPDEFINFNKTIRVEISVWDRKCLRITPPFWYWSIIDLNLRRPKYIPSEQEIESIFDYFRKTGRETTRRELRKYLNYNKVHRTMRKKGIARYGSYPESIRRLAVRLVLEGKRYKDITQSIEVSAKTLRNWVMAYYESKY